LRIAAAIQADFSKDPIVTDTPKQSAQNDAQSPLFYSDIAPLTPTTHKDFKLGSETNFAFAGTTNTVPLTVPEFTLAARHYPILLLGEDLVPTAAVGMKPNQNFFVDKNGDWEKGAYIPAYVRRYPFMLMGSPEDERLTLGVDNTAKSTSPEARALFDAEGKETEVVGQAIKFCEQFHNAFMYTQDFSAALKKAGIAEEQSLEVELTPGQRSLIGSFQRIDEEKFKNLPDATILEWRKNGFLHACYFLLQSMNNWDMLLIKNRELNDAPAA
jgi:hypothetical protein